MKKTFTAFLSLCLIIATIPAAFAVEQTGVEEESPVIPGIAVCKNSTITSTVGAQTEYFSIIDTENGTAQAVQKDRLTGEYTYGPVITMASIVDEDVLDTPGVMATATSPTYHQDTFSNIEYDIWERASESEWLLQRPKDDFRQFSFMTNEEYGNSSQLYNFKRCVDALNFSEFNLIANATNAVFNTAIALTTSYAAINTFGCLTVEAAIAVKEACFSTADAIDAFSVFVTDYNSAARGYFSVYDVSNVYDEQW